MQATHQKLLQDVKRTVLELDPEAEVILFGSRARGDAREDSDWDFLVLTEQEMYKSLKNSLHQKMFELELESEEIIGTIVKSKTEWQGKYIVTPLYKHIQRDGISILDMENFDEKLVRHRLEKARLTIVQAHTLAEKDWWNVTLNRLYYACFYAIQAYFAQVGLEVHTHKGTKAIFHKELVRGGTISTENGKLFNLLFEKRMEVDYDDFAEVEREEVEPLFEQVEHFVSEIEILLDLDIEQ